MNNPQFDNPAARRNTLMNHISVEPSHSQSGTYRVVLDGMVMWDGLDANTANQEMGNLSVKINTGIGKDLHDLTKSQATAAVNELYRRKSNPTQQEVIAAIKSV